MYIGRFAPSPTGELHFGSLLAALASYLDAKSNDGLWLLRIDDIDPPREIPGASQSIIQSLSDYGLLWDKDVIFQSERQHLYHEALQKLTLSNLAYPCSCSRKDIKQRSGSSFYDGHCRNIDKRAINLENPSSLSQNHAWRFKSANSHITWQDGILGERICEYPELADFIILRRDKLWAYQIAVAVDDYLMGITHIVRGNDLLNESAKQLSLINALNYTPIHYSHIPLITHSDGQKLSKQNHAPALNPKNACQDLLKALSFLGQKNPSCLKTANKHEILQSAIINWNPQAIPKNNISINS
jgi:glutamyl-Q tRNA(Asp) synthetase